MMNFEIKRISDSDTQLIEEFLSEAKAALSSFRYFENRDSSVLKNHKASLLFVDGNKKVAYGHLDEENDTVWLGIAVADNFRGKGFGKLMMKALMDEAIKQGISEVKLAVDLDNKRAMALYESFGFVVISSDETKSIMKWEMK